MSASVEQSRPSCLVLIAGRGCDLAGSVQEESKSLFLCSLDLVVCLFLSEPTRRLSKLYIQSEELQYPLV